MLYVRTVLLRHKLKRLNDSKSKAPEVIQEALDEVQVIITEVGEMIKTLYNPEVHGPPLAARQIIDNS